MLRGPRADWRVTLGCRTWKGGCFTGSIVIIISTCFASNRSLTAGIPYFWLLKGVALLSFVLCSHYPVISEDRFERFDWYDFYKEAKDDIPTDIPQPLGREVEIHCLVDANHPGDKDRYIDIC